MTGRDDWCCRCKANPVEVIDDWVSAYCPRCNDRMAELERERREWDYFHRDEK